MKAHEVANILTEVYGYLYQIHKIAKDGGADLRCVDIKCTCADAMHRIDMINKKLAEELTSNMEERV